MVTVAGCELRASKNAGILDACSRYQCGAVPNWSGKQCVISASLDSIPIALDNYRRSTSESPGAHVASGSSLNMLWSSANLVPSRGGRPTPLSEAVATVDWAVSSRPERHSCVLAAIGAYCWMHFSGGSIKPTAEATAVVALVSPRLTAARATFGLTRVALLSMIRLVVGAKGERLTTFCTCEGSVRVHHW